MHQEMAMIVGFQGVVHCHYSEAFLFAAFKDCPAELSQARWVIAGGMDTVGGPVYAKGPNSSWLICSCVLVHHVVCH